MIKEKKLEHYVPRFYLNNFYSVKRGSEYSIYCFDKLEEKFFLRNTKSIGCQKYFYDTDANQMVENVLSKLDEKFAVAYKKLLDAKNLDELSIDEKTVMAYFIANQFLRTPECRRRFESILIRYRLYAKVEKKKILAKKLEKLIEEDKKIKEMQIKGLEGYVPIYADKLLKMKWALIKNKTSIPFWTSDNPVNNYNSTFPFPFGNYGIDCSGIEIYFPLNVEKNLTIKDPVMFKDLPEVLDYKNKNEVEFQNKLQVYWSTRYLFSNDNDFRFAKKTLKEYPLMKFV